MATCRPKTPEPMLVGDILKASIEWFNIREDGCETCLDHVRQMNEWGPDGCAENLETIVGWLKESAEKRGLPFSRWVALLAVKRAIRQARKVYQNTPVWIIVPLMNKQERPNLDFSWENVKEAFMQAYAEAERTDSTMPEWWSGIEL